jgi:acetolactate synthase regulatory subunit
MSRSRFDIVARADPQTLIRLLNAFAQRGLRPNRVMATESNGLVTVRIEIPDLSEQQGQIIAEKMRSSFLVETVRVVRGRRLLKPLSETIDALSKQ